MSAWPSLGSRGMGWLWSCAVLGIAAVILASCGGGSAPRLAFGEDAPHVSAAEQKALPADAEIILASAVCPASLVKSPSDRKARQVSRKALETLERLVRAHPDYLVTEEYHSSDEAPYVFHETVTVLDLAVEQRDMAVDSATNYGGQRSTWAHCRDRLATRLDALVDQAD
jgi:hypothetical protein